MELLFSFCGGLAPFGPKGDFAGRKDERTDGRTDGRTTGLRELDFDDVLMKKLRPVLTNFAATILNLLRSF